jgi:phosphoglycerate kinase
MRLRTLPDPKALKGKRVLVRADFNVPVSRGKVSPEEDWRLKKVVPTVELLRKAGARVILASHLGRPDGKKVASLKMDPIAKRLSTLLGVEVAKLPDCVGPKVEAAVAKLKDRDVVLLENLRFHAGEESDDKAFAGKLAALADVYVNEAFATSHRAAASLVAVTGFLPGHAGPLLLREVEALERVLKKPEKPYLVVMGGAKVSSKIGVIDRMLDLADKVLLGGALIAPFYEALGFCVGATPMADEDLETAKKLLGHRQAKKLVLPHDVLVGDPKRPSASIEVVDLRTDPFELCDAKRAIVDIGPKTVSAYASYLRSARTIVWNGPMGLFEVPRFAHGTLALGRLIAARSNGKVFGVVGGGETAIALGRTGLMECVDHVSTGGGAMLEFLEGKGLPGLQPLIIKS